MDDLLIGWNTNTILSSIKPYILFFINRIKAAFDFRVVYCMLDLIRGTLHHETVDRDWLQVWFRHKNNKKKNVSCLVRGTLPNMLIEAYLDVASLATRGQN